MIFDTTGKLSGIPGLRQMRCPIWSQVAWMPSDDPRVVPPNKEQVIAAAQQAWDAGQDLVIDMEPPSDIGFTWDQLPVFVQIAKWVQSTKPANRYFGFFGGLYPDIGGNGWWGQGPAYAQRFRDYVRRLEPLAPHVDMLSIPLYLGWGGNPDQWIASWLVENHWMLNQDSPNALLASYRQPQATQWTRWQQDANFYLTELKRAGIPVAAWLNPARGTQPLSAFEWATLLGTANALADHIVIWGGPADMAWVEQTKTFFGKLPWE